MKRGGDGISLEVLRGGGGCRVEVHCLLQVILACIRERTKDEIQNEPQVCSNCTSQEKRAHQRIFSSSAMPNAIDIDPGNGQRVVVATLPTGKRD